LYHHILPPNPFPSYEWGVENIPPFKELLISWNALRPTLGHYAIDVAVLRNESWSSWLPYAEWGVNFQRGFVLEKESVRVDQDTVMVASARGFRIRVRAEEGAAMETFRALHVCANERKEGAKTPLISISLQVPLLSQMALQDPRRKRLCSPTSLTAVLRFLRPQHLLDPLQMAERVWDQTSDIYGNWVLNVAEGYAQLQGKWFCWAERLSGFDSVLASLHQKVPLVLSVRGPLLGSAQLYERGHLLVVKGCDAEARKVLCMDPAFETDAKTDVTYDLDDFIAAWQRRGRLAYVFSPTSTVLSKMAPSLT
jgi:hypothetical protein